MLITNIESFLMNTFRAYRCDVSQVTPGVIEVQLTEELDKTLMNRPFYWHYMNSIGEKGDPMKLTLVTNEKNRGDQGEWVTFGSPRLQQIYDYVTKHEKHALLFQETNVDKQTSLYPWLLANLKVTYQSSLVKEELISLGIQLITGKVVVNMMDELEQITLKQQISDFCYTLSPIITLASAYKRLEKILIHYVENQPKEWAIDARRKLQEETALIKHFYQDDLDSEILEKELEELSNRYTPKIKLEVINGGLLYLLDSFQAD